MRKGLATLVLAVAIMGCNGTKSDRQDCLKQLENVRWDAKEDGLEPIGELQSGDWCMKSPLGDMFRLSDWRDKAAKRLCDKRLAPVQRMVRDRGDVVLSLMFHRQCFCCASNWFSLVRDARILGDLTAGGKWGDRWR